jgi:predicted enzyme related to lactoylglutathione lyase
MAKVLGLGGLFIRAEDTEALSAWYGRVLGFPVTDWGGVRWPHPDKGYTLWSPFKADTKYFAPSTSPFMVNLIVDDLDGMLERARAEGVEPLCQEDQDPYGRFAWLLDPQGLKIELWQPPETAP